MKRIYAIVSGLALALVLGACTGSGYTTVGVSADYSVPSSAQLVYAGNGLWVVADSPRPIFYSHGYYWMHSPRGFWYRSSFYNRGWQVSYRVPPAIYRIDRPNAYVRYHVRPGVRVRAIRDHQRTVRGRSYDDRGWRDYRNRRTQRRYN